jgi:pyruvate,water dikinase
VPIVWFDAYEESHGPLVGGKCSSLGVMTAAGLPVPPGFAVTTEAFALAVEHLRPQIDAHLTALDHNDTDALDAASAALRALVESAPLPDGPVAAISAAYDELSARCSTADVPVAVRSSATAEDLPDASFAGQQDTFLWIRGAADVLDHIRKCWSSMYTARAIAYRAERGFDHGEVLMSVAVQKMVNPVAAGVAFTLNPINGDRSKIAIDASWGLGEAVVSGEVTPDNYLLDKVIFEIVNRTVSPKHVEVVVEADRTAWRDVEPERQTQPCLSDDQLKTVARLAKRAEKHYGRPQDVEWAWDADLNDAVLLQARPETVWSNKPREGVTRGRTSLIDGMIGSLLTGVKTNMTLSDGTTGGTAVGKNL